MEKIYCIQLDVSGILAANERKDFQIEWIENPDS